MIRKSAGGNNRGVVAPGEMKTATILDGRQGFGTIHEASFRRLEFAKLVVPLILKHYAKQPVSMRAIAATTDPRMIMRVVLVAGNARDEREREHRN